MHQDSGSFSSRFWLLLPLLILAISMGCPTTNGYRSSATVLGWQVALWASLTPLGFSNVLYLASLPLLAISRGEGKSGKAGQALALLSLLGAIPPAVIYAGLLEYPGYWVWATGFACHAAVALGTNPRLSTFLKQPTGPLWAEVLRSLAISALPAALLSLLVTQSGFAELSMPHRTLLSPSLTAALSVCGAAFCAALGFRLTRGKAEIVIRPKQRFPRVVARWKRGRSRPSLPLPGRREQAPNL